MLWWLLVLLVHVTATAVVNHVLHRLLPAAGIHHGLTRRRRHRHTVAVDGCHGGLVHRVAVGRRVAGRGAGGGGVGGGHRVAHGVRGRGNLTKSKFNCV